MNYLVKLWDSGCQAENLEVEMKKATKTTGVEAPCMMQLFAVSSILRPFIHLRGNVQLCEDICPFAFALLEFQKLHLSFDQRLVCCGESIFRQEKLDIGVAWLMQTLFQDTCHILSPVGKIIGLEPEICFRHILWGRFWLIEPREFVFGEVL